MKKVILQYIILSVLSFLSGYFLKPEKDSTQLVEEYKNQIGALEAEIQAIDIENKNLVNEITQLEHRYNSNLVIITNLNDSLKYVEETTQQQISALNTIGDNELEQFLTNWVLSRTDTVESSGS